MSETTYLFSGYSGAELEKAAQGNPAPLGVGPFRLSAELAFLGEKSKTPNAPIVMVKCLSVDFPGSDRANYRANLPWVNPATGDVEFPYAYKMANLQNATGVNLPDGDLDTESIKAFCEQITDLEVQMEVTEHQPFNGRTNAEIRFVFEAD